MIVAIFVDVPFDLADSSDVIDLFSFDFEMLAINWPLFSSVAAIEAHKFGRPPNVIRTDVDVMLRAVNADVHPAAVTVDFDTIFSGRIMKKTHKENF